MAFPHRVLTVLYNKCNNVWMKTLCLQTIHILNGQIVDYGYNLKTNIYVNEPIMQQDKLLLMPVLNPSFFLTFLALLVAQ